MKQSRLVLLVIFSVLSGHAMAQWAWTDENGRTIFSDRAPSSSVPDKRIFKRPSGAKSLPVQDQAPKALADTANAKTASPAQAVSSAPQASGLDKELAERKKKAEQAQAEQRKVEEERINKVKADNCERARLSLKTLESGARVTSTNAKGEREVMDDAARMVETKHLQGIIATDCKQAGQ